VKIESGLKFRVITVNDCCDTHADVIDK